MANPAEEELLQVKANFSQPWGRRLLLLEAVLLFSRLAGLGGKVPGGKVAGLSLAHISPFLPADLASLPFQLQHCERFCKLRGKAGKRC